MDIDQLIANTIRYSYEDSVVYINISRLKEKVVFSIRDTVQGIAPQYKEKIFDRYFHISGSKKEGSGLRVYIIKELIEAKREVITMESDFWRRE